MIKILKTHCLLFVFLLLGLDHISAQTVLKVACVGNSITEGKGLNKTYPQALQDLLGRGFEVRNFGLSARTLMDKGDLPYTNEKIYQESLEWNPDFVIIKLGTNDTKPQNWKHKNDFVSDYVKLVNTYQELPSAPTVYICRPIPVFEDKWGINKAALVELMQLINIVAEKSKVEIIDLHTPFLGKEQLTYDAIHPNDEGAKLLASHVFKALQKHKAEVATE